MKSYVVFLLIVLAVMLAGCNATPTGNVVAQNQESDAQNMQVISLGLERGEYTPQNIVVEAGKPVKLIKGATLSGCATHVLQPELGIDANFVRKSEYVFTPKEKGEYVISCSMGMYKGKITVV